MEAAPTAAQQDWGEKKRVVRCQGCGAETVLGAEETATLCPFCGSPHVLEDQAAAGIAPESVLPFILRACRQRLPQMAEEALVRTGKGQENGDPRSDQRRLSAPLDL